MIPVCMNTVPIFHGGGTGFLVFAIALIRMRFLLCVIALFMRLRYLQVAAKYKIINGI